MRDVLLLAVSMGRGAAEDRMLDTCAIKRVSGETTDTDGRVVSMYDPVYTGKCRVVDVEGVVSTPEAGGASFTVRRIRVDIPVGAAVIRRGDVVDITGSVTRPDVTGASARVTSVPIGTQVTAYRLGVEEGP